MTYASGSSGGLAKTSEKSLHQIKLEEQGWTFLTNRLFGFGKFGEPERTNEQLKEEYMKKGFQDIFIDDIAFDRYGKQIKYLNCKAVYFKNKTTISLEHFI